jgi:hypothetical protein
MRRGALAVCAVAAGVAGCGGGDDGSPPSPPPVEVTVASSDERALARGKTPQFGDRTTFRGRATRERAPLVSARVELRDAARDRVLGRTVTDRDGRYVVRERFDRNATVRIDVDGQPGPTVDVRRGVALGRAQLRELGDGRIVLRGIVHHPRDIDPDLRFVLFLGGLDDARLPRRPADPRVEELAPGRSRLTVVFRPPRQRWRVQVCVAPGPDSGLSGPPGGCRRRWQSNTAYRSDAERRRKEREAAADRGRR